VADAAGGAALISSPRLRARHGGQCGNGHARQGAFYGARNSDFRVAAYAALMTDAYPAVPA
jgi:hypothetical protein